MNSRLLTILIALLSVGGYLNATTLNDSVSLKFRQSRINIDSTYLDNREALEHIKQTIRHYNQPDSDFVLLNVHVVGGASPEGSVRYNQWLSHQRAERIYDYLRQGIALDDSVASYKFLGRDWEGLRRLVIDDQNVPNRQEVLTTLDKIIEKYKHGEVESDGNLALLKSLNHGIPYRYMYKNLFPTLRESKVVLSFGTLHPLISLPDISPQLPINAQFDYPQIIPLEFRKEDKPFYMALKSNMLLDALAVPEIGAEFYLGKNFSIVGNWMYGWWDTDPTHYYWRMYGGDLAVRWWFGKAAHEKPLTGHHIGIYGGAFTYDFELGGKGYMGGRPGHSLWDRCWRQAGVEYGYSLPIARRLNIDFTLGLGYMGGKLVEYVPDGKCYVWQSTRERTYFGPTKLEVSLVWLIGHGNFNAKKGGKR